MVPEGRSLRWCRSRKGEPRKGLCGYGNGALTIYQCYFSSNVANNQIVDKLEEIGGIIAASDKMAIVAGDLNMKSPAWGSKSQNSKSALVLK